MDNPIENSLANQDETAWQSSVTRRALQQIRELRAQLASLEQARTEPIAIIGMGCRFPGGAATPAAYWQLLSAGADVISEVPPDRWPLVARADQPEPTPPRWGGFLEDIDQFDASFFGISPREATHMDPQQRLLLEVAWEALEDAGQTLDMLTSSQTGVFMGLYRGEYGAVRTGDVAQLDVYSTTGTYAHTAAGRLAYVLDLRGPNVAIDTACSSSLVALHLACLSLRDGACDQALVGGVNLVLSPMLAMALTSMGALAPDGRCKTFDARANGFVSGEGCGVVVLKRLSDARRDGDPIQAVIRGTAINQDGRSAGLTAPNGAAQEAVIRAALRQAQMDPSQVTYVEAHGTGTALGDPIEVDALAATYGASGTAPCRLSSAKANIGHLEAAAGVAGLIKVVLAMQARLVPGNIHLRTLNPSISLEGTRLAISARNEPWDEPRIAAISSFGMSGTNAHAILAEAPAPTDPPPAQPDPQAPYLLLLAAKSPAALRDLAQRYGDFLQAESAPALNDICYTASLRRTAHTHRLALVGASAPEMVQQIETFLRGEADAAIPVGEAGQTAPRLAFVFSGQGSHWAGMGQQLFAHEPVFRDALLQCAEVLSRYVDWSLINELQADAEASRLHQTAIAQPAIFAIQVALAALWRSWGVVPAAIVGQSLGEVAAAHVAGALTLDDAVRVVVHRSRLMQRVAGQGATAVVGLPLDQAQQAIAAAADRVGVAGSTSPTSSVLSGDPQALEQILADLAAQGVFARRLNGVDIAFHSPQMDPLVPELTAALATIQPRATTIPLYSTVTGGRIAGDQLGAAYWGRNLRDPFQAAATLASLIAQGTTRFLEVSPHPVLTQPLQELVDHQEQTGLVAGSLRRNADEQRALRTTLGHLHTSGVPIDWSRIYPQGQMVALPTYPWQHQRYWLDGATSLPVAPNRLPATANGSTAAEFHDWLYQVTWQPLEHTTPAPQHAPGLWLLFADQAGAAEGLKARLEAQGDTCVMVVPTGMRHTRWPVDYPTYEVDGLETAGFQQMLTDIFFASPTAPCKGIVHLWSLDAPLLPDDATPTATTAELRATQGCDSLIALVQALTALGMSPPPRLWLVTRGLQPVGAALPSPAVTAAPLIGLHRTIILEHPELRCTSIDLDATATEHDGDALLAALQSDDAETDIALRAGSRYGARLARHEPAPAPALPEPKGQAPIRADATYLVTGGLGGIGLALARWLVDRGARALVLTGRRGIASDQTAQAVAALREAGAVVHVAQADVTDLNQMQALFADIAAQLPPLRGVFHAAGVADASMLAGITREQFQRVVTPKIAGGWHLHRLTQHLDLDHFVLFSSLASVLGLPGQASYAAANAALDALAHYRHAQGLPALSINWGMWAATGMAGALDHWAERLQERGIHAFTPTQGLAALEWLLQHAPATAQISVAPFDVQQWQAAYPSARTPYLALLTQDRRTPAEPAAAPVLRDELLATPTGQRRDRLAAFVCTQAARTLRCEATAITRDVPLSNLGFDSLMAVEFANRVGSSARLNLPATLIWTYPTVEALTGHLAELLHIPLHEPAAEPTAPAPTTPAPAPVSNPRAFDDLLSAIEGLSDADVERHLERV